MAATCMDIVLEQGLNENWDTNQTLYVMCGKPRTSGFCPRSTDIDVRIHHAICHMQPMRMIDSIRLTTKVAFKEVLMVVCLRYSSVV